MPTSRSGSSESRLPASPSFALLRDLAKGLLKAHKAGREEAVSRFLQHHPKFQSTTSATVAGAEISLRDAQLVVAREHGFDNWTNLKKHVSVAVNGGRKAAVESLCQAAGAGDLTVVTRLLDEHQDIIDELGGSGERTALHFAAYNGHEEIVDLLLSRGADLSVRCVGDQGTPLHFAAERPRLEIMERLLKAGADAIGEGDLHEMGVMGWGTAMQASQEEPQVAHEQRDRAVEMLLQYGGRHTIWSAVAVGDLEAIREVGRLDPQAVRERMTKFGGHRSVLHLAVAGAGRPPSGPYENVVRLLIELGADLDAVDDDGLTPLDAAALGEGAQLARLLLDAGASLTLPAALCLDRAEDVARLAEGDRDALAPGGRYSTLVDQAAARATGEQIQMLIDNGASVTAGFPESRDWTPLHSAALRNNRSAAEVLIRNGADLSALDKSYQSTPAGHAEHGGHKDLASWLREQGGE